MFLPVRRLRGRQRSFPRIRGDVPASARMGEPGSSFSPHTRGCSWPPSPSRRLGKVFPAYAGMFLFVRLAMLSRRRFPRIRGDVPAAEHIIDSFSMFSPHTWGCSQPLRLNQQIQHVFPAYAEMFRRPATSPLQGKGFPRVCGDVPSALPRWNSMWAFSPRMRGCSESYHQRMSGKRGFPRIRGDVPHIPDFR